MNDKDLKNIWKNAPEKEQIQFDKHKILNDMNVELKKIDNSIKWRNVREIIAALIAVFIFARTFLYTDSLWVKVGAGLIIPAALFVIYKLLAVRNSQQSIDHSTSIKDQLLQTRDYLTREQNLLKNILYWYILPLMIPVVIMNFGISGLSFFGLIYLAIVGAFSYFVHYLNQKGAKKFDPYIDQINEKIKQLEADI